MMAARAFAAVCGLCVEDGEEGSVLISFWRNSECVLKMAARKRLHTLLLFHLLVLLPFAAVSLVAASTSPAPATTLRVYGQS